VGDRVRAADGRLAGLEMRDSALLRVAYRLLDAARPLFRRGKNMNIRPPHLIRPAIALAFLLSACGATSVSVENVKVDPSSMNRGESLPVSGKVSSFGHSISTVTYTVVNAPGGITVTNNTLGTDKFSWDLRSDADLKIVTTAQVAPGDYRLRIEAKADDKSDSSEITFTVK
jgi:hypothetical protein